jgi:hypothetical protein
MLEFFFIRVPLEFVPGQQVFGVDDEMPCPGDIVLNDAFVKYAVEIGVAVFVVLMETESAGY